MQHALCRCSATQLRSRLRPSRQRWLHDEGSARGRLVVAPAAGRTSQGVLTVQMKNWEPLVSWPAVLSSKPLEAVNWKGAASERCAQIGAAWKTCGQVEEPLVP